MNALYRIFTLAFASCALVAAAQNPIIQTWFTPDPAPVVHGDTVYLFVDHDEDDAQYFKMKDWMVFSTNDMVNWTYLGCPISTETFSWAKQGDDAWASQAVERNGKWYWYVTATDLEHGGQGIGVAVSDNPAGPYSDPIGHALVPGDWGYIDPSVFIDDDGQAYLFWGNNGLWYAKLGDDMISLASDIMPVQGLDDEASFGPRVMKQDYQLNKRVMKTGFEEASWIYKRDGKYYLEYAAGGVPEHWAYSTAENINGPWTYKGRIMDEAPNSFTIHGGSIEFMGRDFMFYHTGQLPNGGGFRRSTCVEEFKRNADGSIPHIPFTANGVREPVRNLDPYQRIEAETMADSYGLKTDRRSGTDHHVTSIHNGDWMRVRAIDFGEGGAKMFKAQVRASDSGGSIELRLDNLNGKPIAELQVPSTSGEWQLLSVNADIPSGIHDLYFLFHGPDTQLFDFDYWQLTK